METAQEQQLDRLPLKKSEVTKICAELGLKPRQLKYRWKNNDNKVIDAVLDFKKRQKRLHELALIKKQEMHKEAAQEV
jgi:hypothetical protein